MVVMFMLVGLALQGLPVAAGISRMVKDPSSEKVRDIPAPLSPRVATAIQKLVDSGYTLRGLAEKSKLARRSLQKIRDGIEAPSPESLGRLCSVVSKNEAKLLVSAYLDDVHVRIVRSQESHKRSGFSER